MAKNRWDQSLSICKKAKIEIRKNNFRINLTSLLQIRNSKHVSKTVSLSDKFSYRVKSTCPNPP